MRSAGFLDRWFRADFVAAGADGDGVDHAVLFEIDDEVRVGPAVDGGPLAALAAARVETLGGRTEAAFDIGHAHAARGQGHAGFLIDALDQQRFCEGLWGGREQNGRDEGCGEMAHGGTSSG
jgi:hypothetical protein